MMNDTVAKICGKNLPFDGLRHHKGDGAAGIIAVGIDVAPKLQQPIFIVGLKFKRVKGFSFVFAAVIISLKQLIQTDAAAIFLK